MLKPQPVALPARQGEGGAVDFGAVVPPLVVPHRRAERDAVAAVEEKAEIGAGIKRDLGPVDLDMRAAAWCGA